MCKEIVKQYKKLISFYVIFGVIQILATSLGIVYLQKLLDEIPKAKHYSELITIIVVYGLSLLVYCIVAYVDEYPHNMLFHGIYQRLKIAALKKISGISYVSYQDLGTGALIQTIENGANAGRNILFEFYLRILAGLLPEVLISMFFIGTYNLKVMAALLVGYVVVFFISNVLLKYLYEIKNSILTHEEWLSKAAVRGFMELVIFRINKRYESEIQKINETSELVVKAKTKIRMVHELFFALFAFIVILIKIGIILMGVSQVMNGKATVGIIVALITFTDRIYTPIAIFNVIFIDYKLDRVTYDRFLRFINLPEDENLEKGEGIKVEYGDISLQNVSFHYDSNCILEDVSLQIGGGTSAAFVGTSGGGKSTIVKIMLGLLKSSSGKVLVDGKDMKKIKLNEYYDYVSYVSQDAPVFDGTLRENIVFNEGIDDGVIYDILDKVQLKEFVLNLPEKLDTKVGEKGVKLSGGEKQRVAFARVFFQKSKIVILDEPTSALDSITEEKVTSNMLKILKDRTIIIVAHRLHTIKDVNQIFVVDQGRVAEQGTFEELMDKGSLFERLWVSQTKEVSIIRDNDFDNIGNGTVLLSDRHQK